MFEMHQLSCTKCLVVTLLRNGRKPKGQELLKGPEMIGEG